MAFGEELLDRGGLNELVCGEGFPAEACCVHSGTGFPFPSEVTSVFDLVDEENVCKPEEEEEEVVEVWGFKVFVGRPRVAVAAAAAAAAVLFAADFVGSGAL